MIKRLLVITLACLLLTAMPVRAFPRPGHYFYGDVTINGAQADPGTLITAQVNGISFTTAVDDQGRYGYNALSPLFVCADDLGTPEREGGNDGDLISFFIGASPAIIYVVDTNVWATSYPFESGALTLLDLSLQAEMTHYRVALPLIMSPQP